MDATGADISYSDSAHVEISGDHDAFGPRPMRLPATQPTPLSFVWSCSRRRTRQFFRTEWLRRVVERPLFPPSPLYNSVAEIWFYHNAAPRSGRAVRVPGPHTIVGSHPGARLTNHWEKTRRRLARLMEAFARTCPDTSDTARARASREVAFRSWRRLPRDFSPEFCERQLGLWAPARPGILSGAWRVFFSIARRVARTRTRGRLLRRVQVRPTTNVAMSGRRGRAAHRALPPA